jgi:D-alanine-D-alanine ligase
MHGNSSGPLRVVVLAGGDSAERDVSLSSGAQVAAALTAAGHAVERVDPAETDLDDLDWRRFDACFLALHGGAGEDGRVQQWLEDRRVPYTGSGPAASRAAMSKSAAKELLCRAGVPTPEYAVIDAGDAAGEAARKVAAIGLPVVIKPDSQGSSFGLGIARHENDLADCVARSRRYGPLVLAERFVAGRELTVSVLDRKALPVLEIVGGAEVFDFDSKYASQAIEYRFQTGLPPMKLREIEETAVAAAEAIGTRGLVRIDLRLDATLAPWVLELNTLPGMTDHSLAPLAAAEAGIDMPALCDWMVRRAAGRRKKDEE